MERWEYAVGQEGLDGTWQTDTDPLSSYEAAQRAFTRLLIEHRSSEWLIDPQILKRSERHPVWTPVVDHAAELLAEVLEEMADKFGRLGDGIVQGTDVKAICTHIARSTGTEQSQEYDS